MGEPEHISVEQLLDATQKLDSISEALERYEENRKKFEIKVDAMMKVSQSIMKRLDQLETILERLAVFGPFVRH